MIIEIKCIINIMCLNHPQTSPKPPVHGKIVFHETGPWCQKGWGLLVADSRPDEKKFSIITCLFFLNILRFCSKDMRIKLTNTSNVN